MKLWKRPRTLAAARLVVVAATVGYTLAGIATGYADQDDDRKKNERKSSEEIELERSQKEDHEMAGQVLEINTLRNPPELEMANTDGRVLVRVLKTDEIARNAVRLGDHISVIGEKINEQLWEAQQLHVDSHLGPPENK